VVLILKPKEGYSMQAVEAYRDTEVSTTGGLGIVTMLYNGAINFLKLAKLRLNEGDISGKAYYISRATSIVAELSNSLDRDAGEVAINLERLYDFVLDSLLEANLKNDEASIDQALEVLDVLNSAWSELG
jgi:flagellar protein FliS